MLFTELWGISLALPGPLWLLGVFPIIVGAARAPPGLYEVPRLLLDLLLALPSVPHVSGARAYVPGAGRLFLWGWGEPAGTMLSAALNCDMPYDFFGVHQGPSFVFWLAPRAFPLPFDAPRVTVFALSLPFSTFVAPRALHLFSCPPHTPLSSLYTPGLSLQLSASCSQEWGCLCCPGSPSCP